MTTATGPNGQCCKTCDAWVSSSTVDEPTNNGFCRAHPPMPVFIGNDKITHQFPVMGDHGWCREHSMKTEGSA